MDIFLFGWERALFTWTTLPFVLRDASLLTKLRVADSVIYHQSIISRSGCHQD